MHNEGDLCNNEPVEPNGMSSGPDNPEDVPEAPTGLRVIEYDNQ